MSPRTRCPGHQRHWFTFAVGVVAPACVRCGEPNPTFSRSRHLDEFRQYAGTTFPGSLARRMLEEIDYG